MVRTFALENKVVKIKANMIIEMPNSKIKKKSKKKLPGLPRVSSTTKYTISVAMTETTKTIIEYTASQDNLQIKNL